MNKKYLLDLYWTLGALHELHEAKSLMNGNYYWKRLARLTNIGKKQLRLLKVKLNKKEYKVLKKVCECYFFKYKFDKIV